MLLPIVNAVIQTRIVIGILAIILLVSMRRKTAVGLSKDETNQLKGFAVLGVIFAHIGYALVQDTRFLFPLSVIGGVCLNTFLFLSGYGLTQSMLEKPLSPWSFYKRRLDKILIPFWISLVIFFVADGLVLHRFYSGKTILESFLGFFPVANLYASLNSPLWYITFILGYYLLFPLIFIRRAPAVSALSMAALGYLITYHLPLPVSEGVLKLYQTHILALPIGMLAAAFSKSHSEILVKVKNRLTDTFERKTASLFILRSLIAILALIFFSWISLDHAAIGSGWMEQWMSLLAMVALLKACIIAPISNRFLALMGIYSFEIYLLHWPILSRYDIFYQHLPAAVATILYLLLFLIVGYGLQQLTILLGKRKTPQLEARTST